MPLPQQESKRGDNGYHDGKHKKGIVEREHAGLAHDLPIDKCKSFRLSGRQMICLEKIVRPLIRSLKGRIVRRDVFRKEGLVKLGALCKDRCA